MLEDDYLRKVAGYDFHLLRKKYDVQSMWGDLAPQWRHLKSQLETKGPGWYSPAEREERLFTNKSNRPGDDMKEALRTDGNIAGWQAWTTTQNLCSYANLLHPWCFRAKQRSSVTCIPKSGRKNK